MRTHYRTYEGGRLKAEGCADVINLNMPAAARAVRDQLAEEL